MLHNWCAVFVRQQTPAQHVNTPIAAVFLLPFQVPIAVLPGVFLGNAVAADSHHLLQYLGVTHVLNAAQVGG